MRWLAEFLSVVVLAGGSARAQRAPKLELVMKFGAGGGAVHAVASSKDGKWLASGGSLGDVVVWNVATGKVHKKFDVRKGRKPGRVMFRGQAIQEDVDYEVIGALAFSPDGKRLAATGRGRGLVVFDLETGKRVVRAASSSTALAFDESGRVAYFAGRHVVIVDPATGETFANIKTLSAQRIAFEKGELVVARPNGFVERFSVPAGECLDTKIWLGSLTGFARFGKGHAICYAEGRVRLGAKVRTDKRPCHKIVPSPDGTRLAVARTGSSCVQFLDGNLEELFSIVPHDKANDLTFLPDGRIAVATEHGGLQIWSGKKLVDVLEGHDGATKSMVFSPDGNFLGVNSARSFLIDVRKKLRTTEWSEPGVLVAGCQGPEFVWLTYGEMTIWHASAKRAVQKHKLLTHGLPSHGALSPNRNLFAYGGPKDPPRLLDLSRNKLVALDANNQEDGSFHWHPAGAKLLVSTRTMNRRWYFAHKVVDARGVVLRDEGDGRDASEHHPWFGRFSPNGRRRVTVSGNSGFFFLSDVDNEIGVRLWGADRTRPLATSLQKIAWWRFLSEERAVSHDRKVLQLWNVPELEVIQTIMIEGVRGIDGAALSANHRRLAVDSGGQVRIFDVK